MTRPECLWLARHAETATPGIFHGAESDVGLSDTGHRQAAAAAEWFRSLQPTAVVSSAMRRAMDTAAPIAQLCQVPHLIEPQLHERRVGILGGQSFELTSGPWAETIREWSSGNTTYTTPGAESYAEVASRVLAAWERVASSHPGGRVVVIAHGVVCKVLLLSLLEGWGPEGWVTLGRAANLAVTELRPIGSSWQATEWLRVPPPVLALTSGQATGLGRQW
jgi:broad specificity phosphatase PhoE